MALGETAVCGSCGAVYYVRDGHSCRGPRARLPRLAALPLSFAILAALATGCQPSAPPAVFYPASCPPGQHVETVPVGPYGPPGCVR